MFLHCLPSLQMGFAGIVLTYLNWFLFLCFLPAPQMGFAGIVLTYLNGMAEQFVESLGLGDDLVNPVSLH